MTYIKEVIKKRIRKEIKDINTEQKYIERIWSIVYKLAEFLDSCEIKYNPVCHVDIDHEYFKLKYSNIYLKFKYKGIDECILIKYDNVNKKIIVINIDVKGGIVL